MSKKSSLGTGLDELLSNIKTTVSIDNQTTLKQLSIDLLQPGKYQPRQDMSKNAIIDLAASIRAQGILQPLIVRQLVSGKHEIIAGERRWRAAQLAGLHEVPVVIRTISDEHALAISLIENIQREDLNAIDTAIGIEKLIIEFNITHERAASIIGKSRSMITNLLRLLSLPEEIKIMMQQNLLEMGHARALLVLDSNKQLEIAKIIITKKLSVRDTELLIKQLQKSRFTPKSEIDINIEHLQKELSHKLAASVSIFSTKNGKGKIVIKYNNLDELDGILKHMC
jgi:ParB family chromosome partitioning protein